MSKELREALEEYIEKIHDRWLNARDASLDARSRLFLPSAKEFWQVASVLNDIELELTKLIKADEDLAKARVARIRVRGEQR